MVSGLLSFLLLVEQHEIVEHRHERLVVEIVASSWIEALGGLSRW